MTAVDALRGLVMVLMALDHVRDFFHIGAMSFQPDDLTRTTTALFWTRVVTHLCAPVFMFTAGLGASLALAGHGDRPKLSRFLISRGLWLIFLELTALHLAMFFSLSNGPVLLTVLWALGCSMIALGGLLYLPKLVLGLLSMATIALHNLADPLQLDGAWKIFHQPGVFLLGPIVVFVAYPLIPWIAVMAAGFCFQPKWSLPAGLSLTAAFVLLRSINHYGDPQPWAGTFLSFFRTTKYPPSLDFLLMTMGPGLLLLALFGRWQLSESNPLVRIGRVPLFYFLLHFALAHLLAFPLAWLRYGEVSFLWKPLPSLGGAADTYPAGYGYSLTEVYLIWILVVGICYPLCVWFGNLKQRRNDWWLRYL